MTDPNIESYGDDAPEFAVADAPTYESLSPSEIAFANLDQWTKQIGVDMVPSLDVVAVHAAAACAYELRELRRMMSEPPEVIVTHISASGPPAHGVVKIGD